MKNIIVCSDGTGNVANKGRGTNVFKLYEALDTRSSVRHAAEGQEAEAHEDQVAIYCDGVGTDRLKLLRLVGGAFGFGFSRNVRRLYAEIIRVYRRDDQIFLFGFSRGAYTVRVLAGLIGKCGLPSRAALAGELKGSNGKRVSIERFSREAYSAYRGKYRAVLAPLWDLLAVHRWRYRSIRRLRQDYAIEDLPAVAQGASQVSEGGGGALSKSQDAVKKPVIAMVGVWDTVGALGFPVVGLAAFWDYFIHGFRFRERGLSSRVGIARHALSLDDERRTFHPTLWEQRPGDERRIEQVWFAGVHSNVGGGYPKQGVSNRPLAWMMHEAEACGVRLHPEAVDSCIQSININDHVYDSRSGLGCYYRYAPRNIKRISDESGTDSIIDVSVLQRLTSNPSPYGPGAWPREARIVDVMEGLEYPEAAASVARPLGGNRTPLTPLRPAVLTRMISQWGLISFTLLLFARAVCLDTRSVLSPLAAIRSGLMQADALMWIASVGAAFCFLFGLWARLRVESGLRMTWRRIRPKLTFGKSSPWPGVATPSTVIASNRGPLGRWTHPIYHALAAALFLAVVLWAGIEGQKWYASPIITSGPESQSSRRGPPPHARLDSASPFSSFTGYSYEKARAYIADLSACAAASSTKRPSERVDLKRGAPCVSSCTCLDSFRSQMAADDWFPLAYGLAFLLVLLRLLQLLNAAPKKMSGKRLLGWAVRAVGLLVLITMVADRFENGIWIEQVGGAHKGALALSPLRLGHASLATIIKCWSIAAALFGAVSLTWLIHRAVRSAHRCLERAARGGSGGGPSKTSPPSDDHGDSEAWGRLGAIESVGLPGMEWE